MNWETSVQHISLVIEGEEIIPLISPMLGGLDLPNDYYTSRGARHEGQELTPTPHQCDEVCIHNARHPKPKIVFGVDVLCPSCRGRGVATPMHTGEKAERARAQKRGAPMPSRWECDRCGGSGLANVND